MSLIEQAKQVAKEQSSRPRKLGLWGQMFLQSLAANDPGQEKELRAAGQLQSVAQSVDELADAEFGELLNALLKKEKATGSPDYLRNVAIAERCRRTAYELVAASVIVPDPRQREWDRDGYTEENEPDLDEPLLPKPDASQLLPGVIVHDVSGDVLIWSDFPVRRINGSWISGSDALKSLPKADDLKDFWTPQSFDRASELITEAEQALAIEVRGTAQWGDKPLLSKPVAETEDEFPTTGSRSKPRVSVNDRSGDVLIWASSPVVRSAGRWVSGREAFSFVPGADELKDDWTPIRDQKDADKLRAEAEAALGIELRD